MLGHIPDGRARQFRGQRRRAPLRQSHLTAVGFVETCQNTEKCTLSGTRRPKYANEATSHDIECEVR